LSNLTDIKKCNILFVPADKSAQLSDILTKVGANATLVVTEQNGVGAKGSGINFIEKEGKLAFEINQVALTKQRLKASNELMRFGIVI
jgi:YfiR/HmsC-like